MNLFSSAPWLWRALRGQSVTFAALFALTLLGLSVVRILRHMLAALGVPWLALLIMPAMLFGYLARREEVWLPDLEVRRRWSRRLVFGAVALAVGLAFLNPKHAETDPRPSAAPGPTRLNGPPGK